MWTRRRRRPFRVSSGITLALVVSLVIRVVAARLAGEQFHTTVGSNVQDAVTFLRSRGYVICHFDSHQPLVPLCESTTVNSTSRFLVSRNEEVHELDWLLNSIGAFFCVTIAALAAGLTLGLLGLDPLMLLIKERAGATEQERKRAQQLLPIVKQHHLLLVTLLLMNSIANEALPIFLESLVPPAIAVVLSVTLVLFGGEIIPSAVFTGPDQLKIASFLIPLVKTAMCLLYPIAGPIAKLLDWLLHDPDEENAYNRGELSALIRIQFEERLARKHQRKAEKARTKAQHVLVTNDRVGALDFADLPTTFTSQRRRGTLRAATSYVQHREGQFVSAESTRSSVKSVDENTIDDSIHPDEIMMIEGALQMKMKLAIDCMTPKRQVFAIPHDMILNERNVVNIYASGYSRVPVYNGDKNSIFAVLITRQLMVVDTRDQRPLSTLPLYIPLCVSPNIHLVDLLNHMQTGGSALKGGHLALVCAQPNVGTTALSRGEPLPEEAGWMGIITLEDVLESLLQEQIYDEMDSNQRSGTKLATSVSRLWRKFKLRNTESPSLIAAGLQAPSTKTTPTKTPTETTALLE